MNARTEQLFTIPRMYYVELTEQNCVRGLYDLIQEHVTSETVMAEIGSFSGVSSELFALHCKHISCIDSWAAYWEIDGSIISEGEKRFDEVASKYSNIEKIKATSEVGATQFKDGSLDFVYLDALHDYESVKKDILWWLPKLKPSGKIGGHDVTRPGVHQAVFEIFGDFKRYSDTSWLVEKPFKK